MGKYFSIAELCKSETATAKGIYNTPNDEVTDNLNALIDNVLDPARVALGKPISVNSGYRCKELNTLLKGAKNSQHLLGQAADIELGGQTKDENEQLFNWIRDNVEFDQLINEYDFKWVHVSYKKSGNRKQILKIG